jgi:hypothetical protein
MAKHYSNKDGVKDKYIYLHKFAQSKSYSPDDLFRSFAIAIFSFIASSIIFRNFLHPLRAACIAYVSIKRKRKVRRNR